ncbi:MAG: condensation domain-containing protein [Enterobacteriaceae bacterium]|jgi:hypothetical protein|nr:condensation domain-containing protein [Enterobacteriaceae bacterium]
MSANSWQNEQQNERESGFPLGYAQHCFWFVATALGDTANNQTGILIEGELRTTVLEQAINTLIQSHISLRTEILDYAPIQRFRSGREFDLPLRDMSSLTTDEQELLIIQYARQSLNTPFNLKSPPHVRALLFRLASSKHLLFLCFPHIVADGGAIHLFEQQLWRLYAQKCEGKSMSPNAAEPMQIDQWVRHERDIHRRQGRQDRAFWRNHLMGHPYARFPDCYLNQHKLTGHEFTLPFPDDSYRQLNALAQQQKATLQMVFLALVAEAVYEMTGQLRFSLNTVLEGREQPGTETLMAPMLRVMPVPINMCRITRQAANMNTETKITATLALLEQIRQNILRAYDHMECPWSLPVGVLAGQRWHNSPKIYRLAIRAGSWLYHKIFRRARLYPHFLADFLFMEPRPPQSVFQSMRQAVWQKKPHNVAISQPTININILQDVFKTDIFKHGLFKASASDSQRPTLRLSHYWKSEHREQQTASGQGIASRWENDSINIYLTLSEEGKPIMQISCCCFNQAGISRFTGLLKAKLASLALITTQ